MHIKKRYLLLLLVIVIAGFWLINKKIVETKEERQFNLSMQQLRGVSKLVIWEQDFILNNLETQEKTYFSYFKSKESVSTTVNGKMGFHIDLADSIHTRIQNYKDSIVVSAPLQVTYVSLDMGTLQQVKEASLDPSINIDKNEIIKHLDQKALQQYLPIVIAGVQSRRLTTQEQQLSRLTGKPVKIKLTGMPKAADWK
jgi:hypothetical protein